MCDTRRIGGLEMLQPDFVTLGVDTRRIGGLERCLNAFVVFF